MTLNNAIRPIMKTKKPNASTTGHPTANGSATPKRTWRGSFSWQSMAEHGRNDLLIGQQAQNALEHGLKALLEAHGAAYERTHNIGHLLGNARRNDAELADFRLSIPPDVYTAYEGEQEYMERTQPRLTEYADYLEKTKADVERIINRAKEVREQA